MSNDRSSVRRFYVRSDDGTQYQVRNQKDISFEIRLTSKSDQAFRWSTGLYYLNIDREVGVNTGIDSGNGIVRSLYVPNNGVSGVNNATEQLVHDQFDGFWNVTAFECIHLTEQLRYMQCLHITTSATAGHEINS